MKKKIFENVKTIFYALIIAVIIRSLLVQPFYIPSSSMEPNLLVGDRLFVTKYAYGYSKHSFPFSPNFSNKRFFKKTPDRGDVIVFKTPADNRTDYIKRLIGIPSDTIQFINGEIFLNGEKLVRKHVEISNEIYCGDEIINVKAYEEFLPNGKKYIAVYRNDYSIQNSDKFIVPDGHYFFMGDNRDCSKDSRFLSSVGYVKFINLVGRANIIFLSSDKRKGNIFKFWKWRESIRLDRFLSEIK